jgi:hypothetical protein
MLISQAVRARLCAIAVMTASTLLGARPALAHHSFSMFDMEKRVSIVGTVTAFEWTNPHSYIEIDVADDKGAVKHWSIELGSPSILQQSGWKFSSLKKGDKTTLVISPLKSGQSGGFLNTATLPDGRVLGNGPGRQP